MDLNRQLAVERALFVRLGQLNNVTEAAIAVCDAICELAPAVDACSLQLLDREQGGLRLVFSRGLSPEFIAQTDAEALQQRARGLMRGKTALHTSFDELAHPRPPAEEGLAALSMVPVLDPAGEPIAVLSFGSHQASRFSAETQALLEAMTSQIGGVLARIEQQQSMREQLESSQRMLRTVLDAIPARVFWKDRELCYLGCNTLFARDAGETPQTIVGKTDLELPWIDQAELFRRDDRAVIESGEPRHDFAEPQLGADGVLRRLTTSKVPLRDAEGEIIGVLGTYTDNTRLWESEQQRAELALVVEQASESVVIVDVNGVIHYVNAAFERNSGYSQSDVLGQRPSILRSGKHDDAFYRQLWETITAGGTWTGRLINRRKDGSLYEIEGSISPIHDHLGKIRGYVSVRRDITEQAALERQLARARQMEVIGTLAGGIAHDFNNLLSGMLGFAEHARQLTADGELSESLDEVIDAARRAKQLVAQIMTYSRESERDLAPLELPPVLRSAIRLLRSSIPATVEIASTIDEGCPAVLADATQMHQLVINLGTNAYQAIRELSETQRAGAKVTLSLRGERLDDDAARRLGVGLRRGRYACIEVADTGAGIEPELLERIFEPYFTTRRSRDAEHQGTGLGLAIVSGIVQAHAGAVAVESAPGRGTTFRVYLPAQREDTPSSERPAVARPPSPRGEGRRLLFVDDEPQLRRLGRRLLTHLGYHVTLAGDGDEALEAFRHGDFDVIVTDLTMPRMTGIELAQQIREVQVDLPIVLFAEQLTDPNDAPPRAFDRVLLKPFGPTELADAIAQALAQKS